MARPVLSGNRLNAFEPQSLVLSYLTPRLGNIGLAGTAFAAAEMAKARKAAQVTAHNNLRRVKSETMLRITVHDKPRALVFQLEGALAGPWVRELDKCWRSARASRSEPIVCVDLTGVTFVDEAGKTCLATLHRLGAEFVAADCVTKAILDEIAQSAEQLAKDPAAQSAGGEQE